VTLASINPSPLSDLRTFVESQSGQKVLDCYQCGKCSAGCPVDYAMDMGPRQIMRSIQFGLKDEVLKSTTIWLCVSCHTCSSRCPAKIDIARVMESLRLLAAAEGSKSAEKDVELFHRIFLNVLQRFGRAHEFALAASYNVQSRHLFANMSLVPAMFSRGKLAILPPAVKGASEVRGIFGKVKAMEKDRPPISKEK